MNARRDRHAAEPDEQANVSNVGLHTESTGDRRDEEEHHVLAEHRPHSQNEEKPPQGGQVWCLGVGEVQRPVEAGENSNRCGDPRPRGRSPTDGTRSR